MVATAATTYVMIVALPFANQAFREITFKQLMTRGETKIKPRVFYTEFPNLVIYVREVTPGVGWTDVMVSENSMPMQPKTYLAKKGRLLLDESKRSVQMVLVDGTQHSVNLDEPEKYEQGTFDQTMLVIDPESVFPRHGPDEGLHRDDDRRAARSRWPSCGSRTSIRTTRSWRGRRSYSIPAACLAFMLVALGMGVSNRRDGRLASFVLGIGVVFVYWVLMYMSRGDREGRPASLLVRVAGDVGAEHRRGALGPGAHREEAARAGAVVDAVCAAVRAAPRARSRGPGRRSARPAGARASSSSSRSRTSRFRGRAFSTGMC